jgi:hypothetical protein
MKTGSPKMSPMIIPMGAKAAAYPERYQTSNAKIPVAMCKGNLLHHLQKIKGSLFRQIGMIDISRVIEIR